VTILWIACDPIPGTTITICLPRLHLWIRTIIVIVEIPSNQNAISFEQTLALVAAKYGSGQGGSDVERKY
jgi:hypothetical protein